MSKLKSKPKRKSKPKYNFVCGAEPPFEPPNPPPNSPAQLVEWIDGQIALLDYSLEGMTRMFPDEYDEASPSATARKKILAACKHADRLNVHRDDPPPRGDVSYMNGKRWLSRLRESAAKPANAAKVEWSHPMQKKVIAARLGVSRKVLGELVKKGVYEIDDMGLQQAFRLRVDGLTPEIRARVCAPPEG